MSRKFVIRFMILSLALAAAAAPACLAQQTSVRVHDPCAIVTDGACYVFSTGRGIPIFRSNDLYHWTRLGVVFDSLPAWAASEVPGARGEWSPDISYFDGIYHLYYSVSTFGSRRSCIGLAINKTLDPASKDYLWDDQGKVVETHQQDKYNAIDPNLVFDEADVPWLVFGSCWDGIRLRRLDRKTGKPSDLDTQLYRIAARGHGKLLEGPFVVRRGEYFYLFISFDACCQGINSTYKVMVGRAMKITGPYVDRDNVPMTEGGGTLLLASKGDVRGPGHCAVMMGVAGKDWMVHHYYDATDHGLAKLQVRPMNWDDAGWPMVAEPVDGPVEIGK